MKSHCKTQNVVGGRESRREAEGYVSAQSLEESSHGKGGMGQAVVKGFQTSLQI